MPTRCNSTPLEFEGHYRRRLVAKKLIDIFLSFVPHRGLTAAGRLPTRFPGPAIPPRGPVG